jgi:4'-phosphopantetheinyl transferase
MSETLKPDEVHVWYLWPDRITDSELTTHVRVLSDDERTRAQFFRFDEDRNLHILSKVFVRTLLSRYASIDPSDWEFTRNEYGKPAVSGPSGAPRINFNISHTRGLIAGVFALNLIVGIDAENQHHRIDALSIAQNYLAPTEYSALCKLGDSDRHRRFLEYWTLKEAYSKARGMGMSIDLSSFSFEIHNEAARISVRSDTEDPSLVLWNFRLLRPSPDHTVAVAVCSSPQSGPKIEIRDGIPLTL